MFNPYKRKHCKYDYRSGLEERNGELLFSYYGVSPMYEQHKIKYIVPARKATYTPDFLLPNGILIETKGRFLPKDRQKHILIKEQYPDLDLRFVFTNSKSKLYKGSPTSYAKWADTHGFLYADKVIPEAWLREGVYKPRIEALKAIGIIIPKKP